LPFAPRHAINPVAGETPCSRTSWARIRPRARSLATQSTRPVFHAEDMGKPPPSVLGRRSRTRGGRWKSMAGAASSWRALAQIFPWPPVGLPAKPLCSRILGRDADLDLDAIESSKTIWGGGGGGGRTLGGYSGPAPHPKPDADEADDTLVLPPGPRPAANQSSVLWQTFTGQLVRASGPPVPANANHRCAGPCRRPMPKTASAESRQHGPWRRAFTAASRQRRTGHAAKRTCWHRIIFVQQVDALGVRGRRSALDAAQAVADGCRKSAGFPAPARSCPSCPAQACSICQWRRQSMTEP